MSLAPSPLGARVSAPQRRPTRAPWRNTGWAVCWAALAWAAHAQPAPAPHSGQRQDPFAGADLAAGVQLIRQHQCTECHSRHLNGDGLAIYRPGLRIRDANGLRRMVERCDTELSLGLFPEEVTAIAAVLNRDHYRYTAPQ